MGFKEYLEDKNIDAAAFEAGDSTTYAQWHNLYHLVSSESFHQQILFSINKIRRKFQLHEGPLPKKAKPAMVKPKPKMKPAGTAKPSVKPKPSKPMVKPKAAKPKITTTTTSSDQKKKPVVKPKVMPSKPVVKPRVSSDSEKQKLKSPKPVIKPKVSGDNVNPKPRPVVKPKKIKPIIKPKDK